MAFQGLEDGSSLDSRSMKCQCGDAKLTAGVTGGLRGDHSLCFANNGSSAFTVLLPSPKLSGVEI